MKKLTAMVLMALMVVFLFTGCGEGGGGGKLVPYDFSGSWIGYTFFEGKTYTPENDPNAYKIDISISDATLDEKTNLYKGTFTLSYSKKELLGTVTGNYEFEPIAENSNDEYSAQFYPTSGDERLLEIFKGYNPNETFYLITDKEEGFLHGLEREWFYLYRFTK